MALESHNGFATTQQITSTIPNNGNTTALTITQNDSTNNPIALSITNAGTGSSLNVASSSTTTPAITTTAKYGYAHTLATSGGYGINLATNGTASISSSSGLLKLGQLTTGDSSSVFIIDNRSAGKSLVLKNNATEKFSVDKDGNIVSAGSLATAYAAKTTTYTITATDSVIDCTSGTFTVTLPTAVGCTGRQYVIKNSGTGAITVACNGAQTIDGVTTSTLGTQYQSLTVVSNNANWIII